MRIRNPGYKSYPYSPVTFPPPTWVPYWVSLKEQYVCQWNIYAWHRTFLFWFAAENLKLLRIFQINVYNMNRMEFLGRRVVSLGEPAAKNVVLFLHGSGDTGPGIKVFLSLSLLFHSALRQGFSIFKCSGSVGAGCFRASRIRIHNYLYGSGAFF